MKKSITFSSVFAFFLAVWLLFSVVRTLYNNSKLLTQDRHLFFLSEQQRQREIYGDISVMVKQIPELTHGKPFLLTGNDGKLYFFLRYLLYPQKIYWVNNISLVEEKNRPWKFVFRPYASATDNKNAKQMIDPLSGKKLGIIVAE